MELFIVFLMLVGVGIGETTVSPNFVKITTVFSMCSATRLDKNYIITASHCLKKQSNINIIKVDEKYLTYNVVMAVPAAIKLDNVIADGYTLIKVNQKTIPKNLHKVPIAKNIKGKLWLICYPYINGKQRLVSKQLRDYTVKKNHLSRIILSKTKVRSGCSGGSLLNSKGELVGITVWTLGALGLSVFYDITRDRGIIEAHTK